MNLTIFLCVQFLLLLSAILALWRTKKWHTHTNTAASILTIIGVFGTFLGIWLGLQDFDIEEIEASIPNLLHGLKTAFTTSLLGIFSAIILKFVAFCKSLKGRDPSEESIDRFVNELTTTLMKVQTSGETDILAQLKTLNETFEKKGSTAQSSLDSIHKSLTGDDESTVFTQLRDLTSTVSEKVSEIAEKVGEVATGQLIEALREVIRDFNKNLNEQFGENFKQLNEAVEKTVVWQEQYRQQMDELANEFRIAAESIDVSRAALSQTSQSLMTIEDQSENLVSIAGKLDPILHTLNDQLEAFRDLRQKAHEAFPLIETRLNDLTEGFSDAVKNAITESQTNADQLQTELKETTQQSMKIATVFVENTNDIIATVAGVGEELDSVFERCEAHLNRVVTNFTENLTTQMRDILENQSRELGSIVDRNRDDITNHVDVLHTALRKEVNTLNNALEEELGKSLRTLAGHFESLSNGFVQNYSELMERFNEVMPSQRS